MKSNKNFSESQANAIPSTSGLQNKTKKKQLGISENGNMINNSSDSAILDSDTDSNNSDFFSKAGRRLPYSIQEDELILKFVLRGENIYKVGSITLWKELESKKVCQNRTYQSLKNRFTRNILPLIFSKYKHMIKDEETIDKILNKFPEFKRKLGKQKTLLKINLIERDKSKNKIENSLKINSSSPGEPKFSRRNENKVEVHDSSPNISKSDSNIFGEGRHAKKIEFKNDSIYISFQKNFHIPEKCSTQKMGIYQKFLQLKQSNPLVPCSQCGRPGLNEDLEEKSDSEESLIISSSLSLKKPTEKYYCKEAKSRNAEKRTSNKNSSKNRTNGSSSRSPSLLEDLSGGENACSPKSLVDETVSANQDNSKIIYEDEDLDVLYREMAARCRQLIDSEDTNEEEKEGMESPVKKSKKCPSKAIGLRAVSSGRTTNPESFFVNSDSSGKAPPSRSPSQPGRDQKRLLARNMARMLKKNSKPK